MKKLIILILSVYALHCNAQKTTAKILSSAEVNKLFSDGTKNLFNISYPIYKVYQYPNDNFNYYVVLTESVDEVKGKDSISKNIKAIIFKEFNGKLNKELEITDNIIPTLNEEKTIFFWTKYISFEKVENTIVPIIVYGTNAMNNFMDGRIKIIIVYHNQKIVIRHQNAVLDGERLTKIDKVFYTLPTTIQNAVKKKITAMEKADNAILGYGWEEQMKKKKLEIKG